MSTNHPLYDLGSGGKDNQPRRSRPESGYEATVSALDYHHERSERMHRQYKEATAECNELRRKVTSLEAYIDKAELLESRILGVVDRGFRRVEASLKKLDSVPEGVKTLNADVANLAHDFANLQRAQAELQNSGTPAAIPATHVRNEDSVLNAVHADLKAAHKLHYHAFAAITGLLERSNAWVEQLLDIAIRNDGRPVQSQQELRFEDMGPILAELEMLSRASASL